MAHWSDSIQINSAERFGGHFVKPVRPWHQGNICDLDRKARLENIARDSICIVLLEYHDLPTVIGCVIALIGKQSQHLLFCNDKCLASHGVRNRTKAVGFCTTKNHFWPGRP